MSEAILTLTELYELLVLNDAESQMDSDQFECLVSLIDDKTVKTKKDLSEYMSVK